MDALYSCIKEVLFLHPPLILLLHYNYKDFRTKTTQGNKCVYQQVMMSPTFAHQLQHIHKNLDTYDPNRFAPGCDENKAARILICILWWWMAWVPWWTLKMHTFRSRSFRASCSVNYELEFISLFPQVYWNAMVGSRKAEIMMEYKKRVCQCNKSRSDLVSVRSALLSWI